MSLRAIQAYFPKLLPPAQYSSCLEPWKTCRSQLASWHGEVGICVCHLSVHKPESAKKNNINMGRRGSAHVCGFP